MINLALDIGKTATPESFLFYFLAPLSVLAAVGMLLVKKAVHSALLLAWVMISLAIFYIAQDALFLGIVQIVVYTGAVMMLFLFIFNIDLIQFEFSRFLNEIHNNKFEFITICGLECGNCAFL